ncbi:AraC family transcriptional regulator [Paenibacillus sp. Marseille-Q4541]|uniref:AraC family transcriptional regulator n=1 Tax=Paenibacillus sp. Marseille-Q4541 TaxID=2831522 RepID=UPI001BA7AB65
MANDEWEQLQKLLKFTYNYSNIDTVFVQSGQQITWEYGHIEVPEPLKGYFELLRTKLQLQPLSSPSHIIIHNTSYKLNFISCNLYDSNRYLGSIIVGPYLLEDPAALVMQDIMFDNHLSIWLLPILEQYYLSLPLIDVQQVNNISEFLAYLAENSQFTDHSDSAFEHISYDFRSQNLLLSDKLKDKTDLSPSVIEERYRNENKMMSAIEHGEKQKLEELLNDVTWYSIPDRFPSDPLRSRKNLTFVTNTLLRKAAEKGGVHPVYIDSISEKFSIQIERTASVQQLSELQLKMYYEYCDIVRELALKPYSPPIRNAIEYIRLHLDEELSLEMIAQAISLSMYELSRLFKQETGQSIIDYINFQRIKAAVQLLENHNLSITDIAQMVGYNDVNYFIKVFKKMNGITPKQFRKNKEHLQ